MHAQVDSCQQVGNRALCQAVQQRAGATRAEFSIEGLPSEGLAKEWENRGRSSLQESRQQKTARLQKGGRSVCSNHPG